MIGAFRPQLLSILGIILLGSIAYSNTFFNSFHFDDFPQIVDNSAIRNVHDLKVIWNNYPARSVAYFTFALNYHWGALSLPGYHALSLALHLGTALLVWYLALLAAGEAPQAAWIAFMTGAIFVVHPIQTQSVNYIYQRSVLLAAFFYLASLILYLKAQSARRKKLAVGWVYYTLALLAGFLSMFSKENAVTLPLGICLYEYCFLTRHERSSWMMRLPFFVMIFLPLLTWVHLRGLSGIGTMSQQFSGNIGPIHYFLTQLKVIVFYIKLLCFPTGLSVVHDCVMAKSFFEIPVVLSGIFLAVVLWAGMRLFNQYRLMAFGICWFFLTLMPESSFWPNQDLLFEHRLYLPAMGFCFFLSSGVFYLTRDHQSLALRILAVFVLAYTLLTFQRNKVWHDEFSLWDDAVRQAPHHQMAYLNRGAFYQLHGDVQHAMEDYNMVIGLGPVTATTMSNRGALFMKAGDYDHALANYNFAIEINSGYEGTYINRGILYHLTGRPDLALADFQHALKLSPSDPQARNLLLAAQSSRP